MSDNTTLTRCPHCQTRFRVTEEQLGIAAGKVRCGNCMDVFDARANAVSAEERAAANTGTDSSPARPSAAAKQQPKATGDTASDAPRENETRRRTEPDAATSAADGSDEQGDFEDEFLFQDDPEEDATDARYTRSSRLDDDLSDSFMALDKSGPLADTHDDNESFEEVDESWAEAILEDTSGPDRSKTAGPADQPGRKPAPERQAEPRPEPQPSSRPAQPRQPEPPLKAPRGTTAEVADDMSLSLDHDEIRHRQPRTPMNPTPPLTAPPRGPYANLRSTPVAARRSGKHWGTTLLWALGCLLLLVVILSQLFYFQFDRLSRLEPLRPFYALTCPLVQCELPVMVDTDQIESRKLVVRSHPEQPRALLVEAAIVNRAPFPQPFPSIVLTFSNLNNDIVAQRAFKPAEYLAGEARELQQMPQNTPVQIALELRDPGQDAINYDLRFVPAASAE